jgi:hypothetical protein
MKKPKSEAANQDGSTVIAGAAHGSVASKIKTRPSKKSLLRFQYFAECEDVKRLPEIPMDENGRTAAECFHVHETYGKLLPCRDPVLLTRALNGKKWHGLTVTNCAQDYVDRLLFACEIKAKYPEWVQRDILGRAAQLATEQIGFVPTFVKTGEDFTTLELPKCEPHNDPSSATRLGEGDT